MNDAAISLDRLHGIVLPPEVPWWPIAPGWYVVLGIVLALVLVLAHHAWKRHRANAYRRAALRELASALPTSMRSGPEPGHQTFTKSASR